MIGQMGGGNPEGERGVVGRAIEIRQFLNTARMSLRWTIL